MKIPVENPNTKGRRAMTTKKKKKKKNPKRSAAKRKSKKNPKRSSAKRSSPKRNPGKKRKSGKRNPKRSSAKRSSPKRNPGKRSSGARKAKRNGRRRRARRNPGWDGKFMTALKAVAVAGGAALVSSFVLDGPLGNQPPFFQLLGQLGMIAGTLYYFDDPLLVGSAIVGQTLVPMCGMAYTAAPALASPPSMVVLPAVDGSSPSSSMNMSGMHHQAHVRALRAIDKRIHALHQGATIGALHRGMRALHKGKPLRALHRGMGRVHGRHRARNPGAGQSGGAIGAVYERNAKVGFGLGDAYQLASGGDNWGNRMTAAFDRYGGWSRFGG
jgi:hypothetical protein